MDGVFVIGVDTGVGKTTLSAGLLKMLAGSRKVVYWKPVQTGTIVGDDTNDVQKVTQLSDEYFAEPSYRFPDPLSPHYAAKKWGKTIDLGVLKQKFTDLRRDGTFLIIEGAGGLLVPFNDKELQIDLIQAFKLPLLVVTTDRVGAINQTLLTLNECRRKNLEVLGVVVTRSRGNLGNSEGIQTFGKIEILAELAPAEDPRALLANVAAHPGLRRLFKIPVLPV